MNFPNRAMAMENFYVYTLQEGQSVGEVADLNKKKIGLTGSYAKDITEKWLEDNGISGVKIVTYEEVSGPMDALLKGEVDAFVGESATVGNDANIDILCWVGASDAYVAVTRSRADILREFNAAIEGIENSDPYFLSDLAEKYFRNNEVSANLSDEEEAWLNENQEIYIGYLDDYLPYCKKTIGGRAEGLLVDVMNEILSNLEIDGRLRCRYVAYSDAYEMLEALEEGKIDMAFPVSDCIWYLEQQDAYQSKGVISSSMSLICKGDLDSDKYDTIAVNSNNLIQEEYTVANYPKADIAYYDSLVECLQAVESGEADSTIVNGLRVSDYLEDVRFRSLNAYSLPEASTRCFAVGHENRELLSILNRGINTLNEDYVYTDSQQYIESVDYTVGDFVRDYFILVIGVIALVIILTMAVIFIYITKTRHQKMLEEIANRDSLTGVGNRRAYSEAMEKLENDIPGNLVYVAMDLNGLKKTNDELGHVAGDELLRGASECMRRVFPEGADIYRIGGDEFSIIMRSERELVESLLAQYKEACDAWQGTEVKELSVSCGVCYAADLQGASLHTIIEHADNAMYANKKEYYSQMEKDRRN